MASSTLVFQRLRWYLISSSPMRARPQSGSCATRPLATAAVRTPSMWPYGWGHQPGALVVEGTGVPASWRAHEESISARPPRPPASCADPPLGVIARGRDPQRPAPASRWRPLADVDHHCLGLLVKSIHSITMARSTASTLRHTLAWSTPSSSLGLLDRRAVQKLARGWRCSRQRQVRTPTDVAESPN